MLQYLRQLKLFLTVNHDHRRLLLIVSIVIARPQHADMKHWMEVVVLRLLGQIQISGQPGVSAIVEIERPPIHAPYKLSSPVVTAMASVVGIMQFLQDASLEIR